MFEAKELVNAAKTIDEKNEIFDNTERLQIKLLD